ncbi:alkylation response protein AidB-like acyl-CoA dehydrogenase [Jatrophihabitans sp. GAS493]|uniref:acyl-CoA dehydrogenase family protein n=1 Tax=Jatrophihabitans sp. GAS493 TaxID=1907575 RepID=UPI000BB8A4F8|nr:acyl-CoA dehydrogenase family protein [Jatrophihabitans sp. GAS493]SOD74619.1 alkylation response protein AidB-like acyl-CoA dehydrogenase [Jatrophihabitans sp. GAS493]
MIEIGAAASAAEIATIARAWLAGNLPEDWLQASELGQWELVDAILADEQRSAEWFVKLGEAGLATPTWPIEYRGLGLTPEQAAGVSEALSDHRAGRPESDFVGLALAGATILQWGTDEQKQRFLPPLALGRERWCQLFSEPGAGSDLASLSTRAVEHDAGGWLVNGQKVWSSFAHISDFGLLMARTDPTLPKHKGISYFLLDMHSAGVTPRPLRQMTGEAEFNEVFLTDVVVPTEALLGELNNGWAVAISTLMSERNGISGRPSVGPGRAAALAGLAQRTGAWERPVLRDELLRLHVAEKVLQMTTIRSHAEAGDSAPGAEGSVRKLANADLDEWAGTLAGDIDPVSIVGWPTSGPAPDAVQQFLAMKTISIAGGTSEIQRNIIGERLLGLSRDSDPEKNLPFEQRRRA